MLQAMHPIGTQLCGEQHLDRPRQADGPRTRAHQPVEDRTARQRRWHHDPAHHDERHQRMTDVLREVIIQVVPARV